MPPRRRPQNRNNQNHASPPAYGQLEPRALLAGFSWSESAARQLPNYLAAQLSSSPAYVQPPSLVGSSVVTGKSAKLSVLASDDGGERLLKYYWQPQVVPSNGSIRFSSNGSNASKNTTATFGSPGTYQILSRVVDRFGHSTSNLLTVQVQQTASSVAVTSALNRSVRSGSISSLTGESSAYSAAVLDQFGRPLAAQPAISWSVVARPLGSSPETTRSGNGFNLDFDQAGSYIVRATSNGLSNQFTVRVAPVLSRLEFVDLSGVVLSPSTSVTVTSTSSSLRLRGFDQFDNPLAKFGGFTWTVRTRPVGGNLTVTPGNGLTNFAFTRAGNYTVRCESPAGSTDLQFSVNQALSGFKVISGKKSFSHGSTTPLATAQADFTATAVDQFGQPLSAQPQMSWTLTGRPFGSQARGSFVSNRANVAFDRTGMYAIRVHSGAIANQFLVNVLPTLSSLTASLADGTAVESNVTRRVEAASQTVNLQGYDQFGQPLSRLPRMTWSTIEAPAGGLATVTLRNQFADFKFTRSGNYTVRASLAGELFRFSFDVQSVFSRVQLLTNTGKPIVSGSRINSLGTPASFVARGVDQFGQTLPVQPQMTWSAAELPAGAQPNLQPSGNALTASFERAGTYVFVANSGDLHAAVSVVIAQRQMQMVLHPESASIESGASHQFSAQILDQFGNPLERQPYFGWLASGGTITREGLFTAGNTPGNYQVTARAGKFSKSVGITVTASRPVDGLSNSDLRLLVNSAYADGSIARHEMIEILRSAGDEGVVTASELADLRFLIEPSSLYTMPDHVRNLAADVVYENPANATYRGAALGNLNAGSPAERLNKLVDKWFLGTDLPVLTSSSLQYRPASGPLFSGTASLQDARQGTLGDCYLIASLASIAARNPEAIGDMFIDNGDGTYTVRFFTGAYGSFYTAGGSLSSGFTSGPGVADYVTVNRELATFSNGVFAYSNYGLSSSSTTTPLWIALAEKAYAQWNQTGAAGRDGSLNFSAIEGGWMSDVNAQVLGYNSTMYYFHSSSAQPLIAALSSGQAVTLGTRSVPAVAGMVGSHAYTVTAYNSSTGKFTLHNPWGTSHPAPLTWSQLVSSCTAFVTVNPQGNQSLAAVPRSFANRLKTGAGAELSPSDPAAGSQANNATGRDNSPHRQVAQKTTAELPDSQPPDSARIHRGDGDWGPFDLLADSGLLESSEAADSQLRDCDECFAAWDLEEAQLAESLLELH